ncbi:DUF4184 family protein [Algoriphagus sediminis]|uniref:DUF4184 family protein n=1 Tax=Algoriphagus sediminis TaxID=3057113 RepID=A0ABT7YH00_9BACT|nr:DUF4184 family protein [Algoriphagus sediminis]MDN3205635.1 DUF4184 family protein [Algoriphagus sediminis]
MPFTFSHPAAIAPFIKHSEKLSVSAMVIGSIVPDLEFYFKLRLDENIGHKLEGIFLFDFPVALLCFFLFQSLIKITLFQFSPAFIQRRISFIALTNTDWKKASRIWIVLLSIALGLASHLILDSMTHYDGGLVSRLSFLSGTIHLGVTSMPLYHVLQLGFSLLGLVWVTLKLIKLPLYPKVSFRKSIFPFWPLLLGAAALAVIARIYFFPDFISVWDGFMMLVGAGLYGLIFSSLIFWAFKKLISGSDSEFDKLIDAGSIDPIFEIRSFPIEKNQSLSFFGQSIMEVDSFVDESQIIVNQTSGIKIDSFKTTSDNFVKMNSKAFRSTSLGLSTQTQLKGGMIHTSSLKAFDLYFHFLPSLGKYINPKGKLIGIILLIFSFLFISSPLKAQEGLAPSDREEFIQEATKLRSEERFGEAIAELDKILAANPEDAQILLFKGDLCLQNKEFDRAVETYDALLPLNYELTVVRINKSYALFMAKKPSKALQVAQEAWAQDSLHQGAIVNHFNAMLWNSKTSTASEFLDVNRNLLEQDQYLVMKARLATSSGDFRSGLSFYDSLVNAFPISHYILEYGEVLIGKKRWKEAQSLVEEKGSELSDSQRGKLEGLLNQASLQIAGLQLGYFEDIGGNSRMEQSLFWENETTEPVQVGLRVGASQVSSAEGQKTKASFISGKVGYKWNPTLETQAELTLQQVSPEVGDSYRGVTGRLATNYQPNDRRMIGLFYQSDILNFTADLLGKDIRSQDFGYVTHIMLDGRTGIFSQGSFGTLNDQNSRIQFFGSIYRVLRTEPTLKTGLNFSGVGYSDSETTLYFAPDRFLSTELFLDYSTPMPLISKLALQVQLAAGLQKIEEQSWDSTFRGQVELNYRVSGFDLGLRGQFSDVAATSGTGYRFHYATLRIQKKF